MYIYIYFLAALLWGDRPLAWISEVLVLRMNRVGYSAALNNYS